MSLNADYLQHKDFEEGHIPATQASRTAEERSLLPIASLPAWATDVFGKMTHSNRLQTAVQPTTYETVENLPIYAPIRVVLLQS